MANWCCFHECSHPPLIFGQITQTRWLKPGSAEYVVLEDIVLHPKVLKDIAKLSEFCLTGGLEVYHSMLLKYCPKREHFSYEGIKARSQLAAIANNENVGRMQVLLREVQMLVKQDTGSAILRSKSSGL